MCLNVHFNFYSYWALWWPQAVVTWWQYLLSFSWFTQRIYIFTDLYFGAAAAAAEMLTRQKAAAMTSSFLSGELNHAVTEATEQWMNPSVRWEKKTSVNNSSSQICFVFRHSTCGRNSTPLYNVGSTLRFLFLLGREGSDSGVGVSLVCWPACLHTSI